MKNSYVYIIGDTKHNIYKISKANNVTIRFNTLRIGNPFLKIVAVYMFNDSICAHGVEKKIHAAFDALRHSGEWFTLNKYEIAEIGEFVKRYVGYQGVVDLKKLPKWSA